MVYFFAKKTLIPLFRLWVGEVKGAENILNDSSLIIAANHSSYADHLLLCSIVIPKTNKKLHFLAKKEHFDSLTQRLWHKYAGAIPLDREAGGKKALRMAIRALKQKKIIGIYPEGTRTLDGKMQRARTGVARLALLSRACVVPVGLVGTFKIMPKGKYIPRLKRAKVNIGKPMTFEKYYGKRITKKLLREVTNLIMKEIARLSGQKYNFD